MLGGRAADVFGRCRVFIIGLTAFTLCSLLGGFAQSGAELIAARAAQGIGGAILAPASLSLLTATFTEHHERRWALGVWSATAASGAAGGLFLGGLLTDLLGWRRLPVFTVSGPGLFGNSSEARSGRENRAMRKPEHEPRCPGSAGRHLELAKKSAGQVGAPWARSSAGAAAVARCCQRRGGSPWCRRNAVAKAYTDE